MPKPFTYGMGARMEKSFPYILPEWGLQAAIWAGWPRLPEEWGDAYNGAKDEIETFLKALAKVTPVKIACGSRAAYGDAHARFGDIANITLHTVPSGDIWLRDTGPIFARGEDGLIANMFRFNGWGGKYVMPGDEMTAGGIASAELTARQEHDFILEGGAIDLDGEGRLLTTRQCLLNPNRNASLTETTTEKALREALGVREIIWLGDGLINDHTDGHVDNIARFIGPGLAACQSPSRLDDPNADTLKDIESDLRAAGVRVITIPSPGLITDKDGNAMPASHMNFLISNGHVFLPTYEAEYSARAVAALADAMPGYNIIPLPARHILSGGGSFHCMTQQVPKV
ncbi:MAG: agmatine deiminase family protein [Pseudomonadota bacterium]